MIPRKPGPQVILPSLVNFSFCSAQQLTRKVDPIYFHTAYNSNPFPETSPPEFSSKMFNEDRIILSASEKLMQKFPENHYSNTIQTYNLLNNKTLHV